MSTLTLRRPNPAPDADGPGPQAPGLAPRRWDVLALVALVAVSALVRLGGRGFSLWVDEGISVGIASHPLAQIPALMSQDGSPPLYYLLLHIWAGAFGFSATSVRALSLVVALAVIPVAYWAAGAIFDRRGGWMAAVLAAFSPYLSVHSREARMYPLVVLVSLVAVAAFVLVFVRHRRSLVPVLAVSLAVLAYTHNWGLFLVAALALAAAVGVSLVDADQRGGMVRDGAVAFGVAALLYAPWVPTLLAQVRQTGAPWSRVPGFEDLWRSVPSVLGNSWVVLVLAAVAGVVAVRLHRRRPPGAGLAPAAAVLGGVGIISLVLAWGSSHVEPAWSPRYFGIALAPLMLLASGILARAGRIGVIGLAGVVALATVPSFGGWTSPSEAVLKSNVAALAERLGPVLAAGDVVFSAQFEQVPLLAYYLGSSLHYADPSGVVSDPEVADWRNAYDRMESADPAAVLAPLVANLAPGAKVVIACPRLFTDASDAPWYRFMDRNCETALAELSLAPGMVKRFGPLPSRDVEEEGASMSVHVYERRSP